MVRTKVASTSILSRAAALCAAAGVGALLVGGTIAVIAPSPAQALPQYAAKYHFACSKCHVNPAGGGPRNAFGQAFEKAGNKLPK